MISDMCRQLVGVNVKTKWRVRQFRIDQIPDWAETETLLFWTFGWTAGQEVSTPTLLQQNCSKVRYIGQLPG